MKKIPITKPVFDQREIDAITGVLQSGWVMQGPKVAEFEQRFAEFQGAKYALAASSGTTVLHLALLALGIHAGDEVIVPAFTFPATANAILYVGARPVFADITLPEYNIDPGEVERKVTGKTKAIIPVHLFGLAADMDSIMGIAKNHRLCVLEDAACAHGAEYRGTMVGTIGDCGMFSFHPRKLITTGEGGMLTTNREDIAETVRALRSHGESLSGKTRRDTHQILYPEYTMLGYNYRMTDLQGAVGVEQMKKLPTLLKERQQIAARYHQLLANPEQEEYLRLPGSPEGLTHSYQSYVLLLTPKVKKDRDQLSHELQERGIATRKGTYYVPGTKFYRETFGFQKGDLPCSEQAESRSLALPLYPGMQEDEMEYVVDNLCDLLRRQ